MSTYEVEIPGEGKYRVEIPETMESSQEEPSILSNAGKSLYKGTSGMLNTLYDAGLAFVGEPSAQARIAKMGVGLGQVLGLPAVDESKVDRFFNPMGADSSIAPILEDARINVVGEPEPTTKTEMMLDKALEFAPYTLLGGSVGPRALVANMAAGAGGEKARQAGLSERAQLGVMALSGVVPEAIAGGGSRLIKGAKNLRPKNAAVSQLKEILGEEGSKNLKEAVEGGVIPQYATTSEVAKTANAVELDKFLGRDTQGQRILARQEMRNDLLSELAPEVTSGQFSPQEAAHQVVKSLRNDKAAKVSEVLANERMKARAAADVNEMNSLAFDAVKDWNVKRAEIDLAAQLKKRSALLDALGASDERTPDVLRQQLSKQAPQYAEEVRATAGSLYKNPEIAGSVKIIPEEGFAAKSAIEAQYGRKSSSIFDALKEREIDPVAADYISMFPEQAEVIKAQLGVGGVTPLTYEQATAISSKAGRLASAMKGTPEGAIARGIQEGLEKDISKQAPKNLLEAREAARNPYATAKREYKQGALGKVEGKSEMSVENVWMRDPAKARQFVETATPEILNNAKILELKKLKKMSPSQQAKYLDSRSGSLKPLFGESFSKLESELGGELKKLDPLNVGARPKRVVPTREPSLVFDDFYKANVNNIKNEVLKDKFTVRKFKKQFGANSPEVQNMQALVVSEMLENTKPGAQSGSVYLRNMTKRQEVLNELFDSPQHLKNLETVVTDLKSELTQKLLNQAMNQKTAVKGRTGWNRFMQSLNGRDLRVGTYMMMGLVGVQSGWVLPQIVAGIGLEAKAALSRATNVLMEELAANPQAAYQAIQRATPANISKFNASFMPSILARIGGEEEEIQDDQEQGDYESTSSTHFSLIPEAGAQEASPSNLNITTSEEDMKPRSNVLSALFETESSNNPKAVGPKTKYGTAKGLGQLLDSTGKEWARKLGYKTYDPFDEKQNRAISEAYLSHLLDQSEGSEVEALARYNFGMGNVDKLKKKYGDRWVNYLPKETSQYVLKILAKAPISSAMG